MNRNNGVCRRIYAARRASEVLMISRLPLLLLLTACATGSPNTLAGASSLTAAAIGAATGERSAGGCIAICTNGTVCNPRSGLCEQQPCRGRCGEGERCEETFAESKCIPGPATGVVTEAKGTQTRIPVVVPVTNPPDENHASPTIVPAAEQNPPR
jgi:hypothetical protein